jgi:rod shape-determining protein MreB and related proteins
VATDVAVDVGTSYTRLATVERGLLFAEPTVVAIDTRSGVVVEAGHQAHSAVVRSPRHVVAFRPLAKGATVDFDVAARMFRSFFDRAGFSRVSRVRVVMSVPAFATSIERRALRQAALQAGAVDASLVETPIAAAIGLGMPVHDPVASAVVALGYGSSEAAIISLGGIVTGRSLRIGGSDFDTAIATMLRHNYGVVVAPPVVESLKKDLASALGRTNGATRVIPARTVDHGEPVSVEAVATEINESIRELVHATVRMVQETLGEAPPDLAQDVLEQGLSVVGGHAQLGDLAELIATETGVRVHESDDTELVVIRGLERCLGEMSSLHALFRSADL